MTCEMTLRFFTFVLLSVSDRIAIMQSGICTFRPGSMSTVVVISSQHQRRADMCEKNIAM